MKKLILVAATCAMFALAACSDDAGAREVLEDAGYKNITTTGYAIFGCGSDDGVHTGFTAISPGGRRVNGVVCAGFMFKGATIRITG